MLVSFLTICMLSGLSAVSVLAADGTPYTYTVTLSAGNKGVFNGAAKLTGLRTGDAVSFDISQVQVTDEKYYVKGIRLSGRDNEEALAAPAFRVTGDADYVVAYGIKGNQVAYTVNYQDGSGNALAESKTFYGNVGDSPVVAYRYIENYVPQALALTGTLVENEAENVFTFVYQPGESGTVVQTIVTTETVTVQGRRRLLRELPPAVQAEGQEQPVRLEQVRPEQVEPGLQQRMEQVQQAVQKQGMPLRVHRMLPQV